MADVSGAATLAYLLGRWSIERHIHESPAHRRGTFTGLAEISPDPGGTAATYQEHGRLRWPTYDGPANRRLRYELTEEGVLAVRFPDGRQFHTVEVRRGRASYRHPCGADVYVGTLTVVDEREWRQAWRVTGEQQLEIRTRFLRRSA